jgi:phenylacetate-coenzyme A ligase PaaK-like adenylate-forming protein
LEIINAANFDDIAIKIFRFQAKANPVYAQYLQYLKCKPEAVEAPEKVPFLPIGFFKTHDIRSGSWSPQATFFSSGTTGTEVSRHAVHDVNWYHSVAEKIFNRFFGPLSSFHLLALLPSYLERQGSSLIGMMNYFIKQSGSSHSGFYLNNHIELIERLKELKSSSRKSMLWGVSFALLELAENHSVDLSHCIIMETGGMKGRRQELIRKELHDILQSRFGVSHICSEYGMTELLSQAYSSGAGRFQCPAWMRVLIRDINDPFQIVKAGRTGAINVIDLANFHSCSFIETQDLGMVHEDGSFEVLGRMDNSDIRGCNLLVA